MIQFIEMLYQIVFELITCSIIYFLFDCKYGYHEIYYELSHISAVVWQKDVTHIYCKGGGYINSEDIWWSIGPTTLSKCALDVQQ